MEKIIVNDCKCKECGCDTNNLCYEHGNDTVITVRCSECGKVKEIVDINI